MPDLTLKATMDSTGVKKGLDSASGHVKQFSKSFSGVSGALGSMGVGTGVIGRMVSGFQSMAGVFGVVAGAIAATVVGIVGFIAGVGIAVGKTLQWGDALGDAAAQSGITAEELQRIQNAALGTSASADNMTAALGRLEAQQGEVIQGNKKSIESFRALGLTQEQVAEANPAELLKMVARGYVESGQSASAYAAMADLLGKRALPVLREALVELGSGMETVTGSMRIMSETQVARLGLLADKWTIFRAKVGMTLRGIAADIIEAFSGRVDDEVEQKLATAQESEAMKKAQDLRDLKARKAKDARKIALKEELDAMEREEKKAKAMDVSVSFSPIGDALTKIGGQVGGQANNVMMALAQRHLAVAERMAEYEKEIAANTRKDAIKAEIATLAE